MKFESVQKFVLSQCSDLIALNLRSLTTMYIESQKLESFELNSDYLPSLEIISLGYNRLKTIPAFLYKLKNIQNIYLNNNKIKTIKVPRLVSNFIDWFSDRIISAEVCQKSRSYGYHTIKSLPWTIQSDTWCRWSSYTLIIIEFVESMPPFAIALIYPDYGLAIITSKKYPTNYARRLHWVCLILNTTKYLNCQKLFVGERSCELFATEISWPLRIMFMK